MAFISYNLSKIYINFIKNYIFIVFYWRNNITVIE
jgi:hypothetical protein